MTLGKADIISTMCVLDPTTKRVKHIDSFENTISAIQQLLAEGNDLTITKLGSFKIRNTKARIGRNPITGEAVDVPASKRLVFKAAISLKNQLKNMTSAQED